MSQSPTYVDAAWQKTRAAFVWTSILNAPFWAVFNMLPFILYKDLHATALQITIIIILKPAVSLIALYWSSFIERRADRLLANIIWARAIGHLPFLFFPFIDNPWYFIAAFGFYMALSRGTVPAWMEILKINIPNNFRGRVFAYSNAISHVGAAIIPFALGGLMDGYAQSWRWIFPVAALISLGAILFKLRIPALMQKSDDIEQNSVIPSPSLNQQLVNFRQQMLKPWKSAWKLICRRPDYTHFQLGFMLGGSGLIIMQPSLPVFFMDKLDLSYTELAVALTLCKGLGFAISSSSWSRLLNKIDIYRFNSWVTLLAFMFPLCLLAAQGSLIWLYGGYILYGVMQAGSEMSWNLSGPLFAKDEDSSVYTNINVMSVGLRGCFVPIIGSILAYFFHASGVMLIGSALCFVAALCMAYYSRQERRLNFESVKE